MISFEEIESILQRSLKQIIPVGMFLLSDIPENRKLIPIKYPLSIFAVPASRFEPLVPSYISFNFWGML